MKFRRQSDESSPIGTPGLLAHVPRAVTGRIILRVMDVAVIPLGPDHLLLFLLLSTDLKPSKKAVAMDQATRVPSFRTKESVSRFAKTPMKGSDSSFRAIIRNRICKGEGDKVLPVEFGQPISDFLPIAPLLALLTTFLSVVPMPRRVKECQSSRLPESTNGRRFRHQKASGLSGLTRLRGLRNEAQISRSAEL